MDKKRKSYYVEQMRKNKHIKSGGMLEIGIKGYLCSCQNREKECVKEAYNVLNKYYEMLHVQKNEEELQDNMKDVSDDLQNEIKQLQSESGAKNRFKSIESGAKNLLFIRTNIDNHSELIDKLIYDLVNEKQPQTRFLVKIIPIDVVCKAKVDDIKFHIGPLLEKALKEKPGTFAISFNSRNSNSITKDDIIPIVADMVVNIDKDVKVNLTQPELSIIIEVIKSYALLGVIRNFVEHKKYNLLELCKTVETVNSEG